MRNLNLVIALLFVTVLLPSGGAAIDTCAQPLTTGSPVPQWNVPVVSDVRTYALGGACTSGGVAVASGSLPNIVPACTAPGTYVVPGGYCGVSVPPNGSVGCFWWPTANTPTMANFLTVGFDKDNDGNIWPLDGQAFILPLPNMIYWLTNPHNVVARVIAYPTHAAAYQSYGDQTRVGCL